ncbi:MAG: 3-hydroxyacyl-CoA dehydrogenase family protein [Actinomycetota bacterium]|jgi:3-hydroxybutyryl-CoA dehydrogenase|nr:3-hydroxyacyl-CoA dehydrogenase family protein [Actinomycetota bacterium]
MGDDIRTVAVVGAGIMGHGIAQVLAAAGRTVLLADRDLATAEAGRRAVEQDLESLAAAGHGDDAGAAATLARIAPVAAIAEAVADADLVVEAVPEVMTVKRTVWEEVSATAREDALLATNTSSFDVDALAAAVTAPARFLGTHWYNPPYLVPCVEVVRGSATEVAAVERVVALLTAAGKLPVPAANTAGFVGNRLQFALVAEAFRCLEDGVATAADIDLIVTTSFGMRLAEYGPFQLADMGGLDTYQSILRYLAEHLGPRFTPPGRLEALVAQGRLGTKTTSGVYDYTEDEAARLRADRDRRLARRLADWSPPARGAAGGGPHIG